MRSRLFVAVLAALVLLPAAAASAQSPGKGELQKSIAFAKARVYPALVNISVISRQYQGGRPVRVGGMGSGVIVSPSGHVLTNFHVAGGGVRIECTLPTNESIQADVVVHDPLTDLSVLKLRLRQRAHPEKPLPFAALGNSDALEVGDYVLAMGNPRGLSSSMTLGVVANTKRVFTGFGGAGIQEMRLDDGQATGLLTRWIQHDALIQPGNSGGPLVNLTGEVIGINELGGTGMGFAIPSNLAAKVMHRALATGEIRRGWLGLGLHPVAKMGRVDGALVSSVLKGSPAEKAGILPGDVVLVMGATTVRALFYEEIPLLYQAIAEMTPDTTVPIAIERDGKHLVIPVAVGLMEPSMGDQQAVPDWGVTIRGITGPMALSRRWPTTHGVLITGVRAGEPASEAKPPITRGVVVTEVAGEPVTDIASFVALVEKTMGNEKLLVRFRVNSQDLLTALDTSDKPEPKRGRELPKAWIGVRVQVLTSDVAEAMGLEKIKGFRVTEVFPGTEAEKAGLRPGDIVTAIDGDELKASRLQDIRMWTRKIENLVIETPAALTVLRDGKTEEIAVLLQETPTSSVQAKTYKDGELEFSVRDITFMDRISRRWSAETTGVVVASVASGGWANLAGLAAGDVIQHVQGREVVDIASFETVLKEVKKERPETIRIFVRRGFRTAFVFIEPDWD